MIVAITGHRPESITDMGFVDIQLRHAFADLGAKRVIQGMAAGVDLRAARAAFLMRLPWTSVRPWAGHKPVDGWENHYRQAWEFADERVTVNESEKYPGPHVYHDRNHYMVDHGDLVVAVWNGSEKGGTYSTVKYAQKVGKKVFVINPKEYTFGWLQQ